MAKHANLAQGRGPCPAQVRIGLSSFQYQYNKQYLNISNQQISNYMLVLRIICFLLFLVSTAYSQCCTKFQGKSCIGCPNGTHLFRGSCLNDVENCASYKDGFDCQRCIQGFQLNTNGQCIIIAPTMIPPQPPKQFVDIVVDPKQLKGPAPDAYLMVIDYFTSAKAQARRSEPVYGLVRTYRNGTVEVTIEYKDNNSFLRGVVVTNQDGTIMRQVSFAPIATPTVQNISIETPKTTQPIIQNIDIKIAAHRQKVIILQNVLKSINNNVSIFDSGKFTNYPNGSYDLNMTYTGVKKGDMFSIFGTVSADKKANLRQVRQTAFGPADSSATLSFTQIDSASGDQNLFIVSDFINFVQPKYNQIQPTRIMRAIDTAKAISYYKLTYTVADGSSWEVAVNVNTNTFIATFQTQTQLSAASNTVSPTFVKVQTQRIFSDFYYIMVQQAINKQFNNKYADSTMRSAEKAEDVNSLRYRLQFEQNGFVWEVQALISKSTFGVTGIQQTRRQAIQTVVNVGGNVVVNTTSSTNSSNSSTNITRNNTVISVNSSSTNSSTTTIITNNASITNINNFVNNIVNNTIPTPTPTPTPTPGNNNPNPITNGGGVVIIGKNTTLPPSTDDDNTGPDVGTSTQPVRSPLPSNIASAVASMTQVPASQFTTADFLQMDTLLRQVNSKELTGAIIHSSYYTQASFTRNYNIYYQRGIQLYEGKISRDTLRKRVYVLSFTKVG